MVRITIDIKDTPVGDGTHFGKIEVMPETMEPVSRQELYMRDMIMEGLEDWSKKFVQSDGVTKSIIARVPLKNIRRKKDGERTIREDGGDTGKMR